MQTDPTNIYLEGVHITGASYINLDYPSTVIKIVKKHLYIMNAVSTFIDSKEKQSD